MTLILKKKKKAVLPAAEEITTFPSLGLDCQEVSPRAEVRMVEAAGLSGEDAEIYEEVNPLVDVDFAMKFKYIRVEDFEGDAKAMEKATEMIRARKEVIRKIKKSAGLRILRRDSKALDEKGRKEAYFILVSAPAAMLVEEAERINMSKKLKAVFTDFESDAVGYEKFRAKDVHLFESSPGAGFFTSLERQRCIYAKLEASLVHGGAELDLDGMKEDGIIADWTFMPNMYEEDGLMKSWVTNYFSSAPVHEVRDYLGEKVGFYFAFLDHYIYWLRPLSIFSLATFAYQMVLTARTGYWQTDNGLVPFYAIIICLWSTAMIETWKRRQSVLAWQWDSTGFQEDEPSRPEYLKHPKTKVLKGAFVDGAGFVQIASVEALASRINHRVHDALGLPPEPEPLTRAEEGSPAEEDTALTALVFPDGDHIARVTVSFAFTISVIAAVAVGALFTLAYKIVLVNTYGQWGNYLGSLISVVFIAVMDIIWAQLAVVLNNWEMYRTDSLWYGGLVYKSFLFRFINKNATPFYIAFVQGLQLELFSLGTRDTCPNDDCLRALSDYLLVAVVFSEVSRNLLTLVPLVIDNLKARHASKASTDAAAGSEPRVKRDSQKLMAAGPLATEDSDEDSNAVERIEAELMKTEYPGTFNEMLEMMVQFGYVTMFAVGFPVAPFFVQLNNMIERKTDALKTLKMRRPRYRGAQDIGSWQYVLEFLTVISVMTNMLILYFSSKVTREVLGRNLSLSNVLLVTVVVEHILFAIKLGLSAGIPDVPRWVERARARQVLRRRAETSDSEQKKNKELADKIANMRDSDDDEDTLLMA